MPRKAKVSKTKTKTTTPRKTRRYLNQRVALVISCLYFIAFVLSPIKYDIFMTSKMSLISNALFIVSLVVSAMTLLEINFHRYKGKKVAIIALLIPVSTFIYLVINVLVKNTYYVLYILICTIVCIIYDLVFFKIKNCKFIKKFPIISYVIYIAILLAIYVVIQANYAFFYNPDVIVDISKYGEYIRECLKPEKLDFLILYSIMYMGIISILVYNIFNRIYKKSLK